MRECPGLPIHIKSLVRPLSVVANSMERNLMHALTNAENFGMFFNWGALRAPHCRTPQEASHVYYVVRQSMIFLIFEILQSVERREGHFLGSWCNSLPNSPHHLHHFGDWAAAVLSPHQGIDRPQRAAKFTTSVV